MRTIIAIALGILAFSSAANAAEENLFGDLTCKSVEIQESLGKFIFDSVPDIKAYTGFGHFLVGLKKYKVLTISIDGDCIFSDEIKK